MLHQNLATLLVLSWLGLHCTTNASAQPTAISKKANHLATETSPYLLMHAHNPVDWYAWSPAALLRAKEENKLIFLSIGYSSCHWCHVMERESFLDEEIAKFLNEHFVCIKVDREERPDVDDIYMTSLHIYNQISGRGGGGGWPLSMFLTPTGSPFFGGTYFPARDGDRPGSPGFLTVIKKVDGLWKGQPELLQRDAQRLADFTRKQLSGDSANAGEKTNKIDKAWVAHCTNNLRSEFDSKYGGFGFSESRDSIPKFPQPGNLEFLLKQARRHPEDQRTREMVVTTLRHLAMGGIFDHVGGGFHRYSVDRYWRIPHFEKMLYDNAWLLSVYAEAYEVTGENEFRVVAERIVEFVLRELLAESGGFYAAIDAESEDEEGKFYRWKKSEIMEILSEKQFELAARVYGLDAPPNFEFKFYVPQLTEGWSTLARQQGLEGEQLVEKLRPIQAALLAVRNQRVRPLTDDKILTAWNGLMIRGLADSGRVLENPKMITAAARAADFVWNHSKVEGHLRRTFTKGQARLNAYLDDYAFLIAGMLALHAADGDERWLVRAEQLQSLQDEHFWDEEEHGYFLTSDDHETLIARAKPLSDNALPSGNSVSVNNLLRLEEVTGKDAYRERAQRTLLSFSGYFAELPAIAPVMLISVDALAE